VLISRFENYHQFAYRRVTPASLPNHFDFDIQSAAPLKARWSPVFIPGGQFSMRTPHSSVIGLFGPQNLKSRRYHCGRLSRPKDRVGRRRLMPTDEAALSNHHRQQ
jgi:hypothetical protein